jgi:hypothetical protein
MAESTTQFDGVDAEQVKHVVVHDGKLLHGVVDVNRAGLQAESSAKPRIGDSRNARRPVSGEIDGNAVRLPMVQG